MENTVTNHGACYVGLPTDPRKEPERLTANMTDREAFQERDRLRAKVPSCEVFTDPGAG